MGIFRVPLHVGNPGNGHSETVQALVDTGATFSMMPASLLQRLGIEAVRSATFRIASGETVDYPTGVAPSPWKASAGWPGLYSDRKTSI